MVRSGGFCTTYHHQNQRKSVKIPLIHDPETLRITGMSSWILLSCWKGLAIRWFTLRPHNQCTNHFINFHNPLYWALNLYLWCPFWGREQVWKRGSKGLLLSIMLILRLLLTNTEHRMNTITGWWSQPIWKIYKSNWKSSRNRGEHKKYVKPPPSSETCVGCFWVHLSNQKRKTCFVMILDPKWSVCFHTSFFGASNHVSGSGIC